MEDMAVRTSSKEADRQDMPGTSDKAKKLLEKLEIGSVTLANRLILAPMAGVSDLPFRVLCHEQGAGLVCTEMVSAKAITYRNRNTADLLKLHEGEHPVSLQLFGSEPETIAEAIRMIEDVPYDILDINMGCPVPKVAGNGEGSALMKDPPLVGRIVEAAAGATDRPVTVKIRKGFDAEHVNAVEVAHIAQESGAAAVGVHGRTREQYYEGKADWDIIARVKDALQIPVFGNGDITDPKSAIAMMGQTGCDAVMIARGARGNPWLFSRIQETILRGSDPGRPAGHAVKEMILRHARMQIETKGEYIGIREMRKHVAWYTVGYPHSARIRASVNEVESLEALQELLDRIFC